MERMTAEELAGLKAVAEPFRDSDSRALNVHVNALTILRLVEQAGRADRAERALIRAGFEDLGGQEWKPPLGKPPRFIEVPVAPAPPVAAVEQKQRDEQPYGWIINTPDRVDFERGPSNPWDEGMGAFPVYRASPAVPVAAGLPAIPEGPNLREWLSRLEDESPNYTGMQLFTKVRTYLQACGYLAAAPVLPEEVPSQPQDQLGSIRPSAEPAGQQEITRLDIMSLIRQQCHRVYASAIDREEIDTKYMAEIEDALRNYSKNSSGCPAAPAGFDERESFIWSLGYNAGKECSTKPASSPIAEPDTATQAMSELVRDAARYNWIRESGEIVAGNGKGRIAIPMYAPTEDHKAELDKHIDAAIFANQATKD